MRLGYAAVLAALVVSPAMAQEFIIQAPNRGAASQAMGEARQENRQVWQDLGAARRDKRSENWYAAHGNYLGAWRMQQRERGDVANARREHREAVGDVHQAQRDNSWKLSVEPR
jgi:hypothetical protein